MNIIKMISGFAVGIRIDRFVFVLFTFTAGFVVWPMLMLRLWPLAPDSGVETVMVVGTAIVLTMTCFLIGGAIAACGRPRAKASGRTDSPRDRHSDFAMISMMREWDAWDKLEPDSPKGCHCTRCRREEAFDAGWNARRMHDSLEQGSGLQEGRQGEGEEGRYSAVLRFKKGDKVRVRKAAILRWRKRAAEHGSAYEPAAFGKVGKVVEIYPGCPRIARVRFDGQHYPTREDDLELAPSVRVAQRRS